MSAITKQIAAVEFHVNARQANAALESMRQSAEDAREEMAKLQEQSDKGVKTVMVGGKDMDITKRIRDLNATAKAFEQAAQSQIKGVKAWNELWQHAKMGNIEQLTGQQIKAGVNGAKRQYDRLILGDEEDRRKAAAIRDIIDQANIVLDKLKGDTDKVIQTLSDGGHVADEVLQREKKNLEDMLSLTEKFSPEWQDYNRQLQAITKGIEEQAAQEKRLRGELVDANDARREAAKLDKDVAQAAKEQHAAQQQKIDDAQKQMQQYQEQRRQHQETAQKITDEIEEQDRQIASQSQLVESIKRENHERTKKSNVLVQEADQADKTAAKAKRAADSSAKVVEKFSDKLQKAKDDVAKLQEQLDKLGNTTETPKVDTSKIDALKKQIEGLKAEYKQLSSDWIKASLDREPHKMYASYEDFAKEASKKKGYDFEMDEGQYLEKMRKRRADTFEFMTGDEVLHSPAYSRIKDVAAGHTEEDDLFGPKEAKDILDGQKAYTDACDKVTEAISKAHASLRKAFDDNLQPEQVQNIAKQLHKLQALYSQFMDLGYSSRLDFSSGGKNIVKDMFEGTGTDFDKEVAKAEAQIKRTLSTAEKQKFDYYDKNFEKERNEAKQKQDEIDKRQEQIKKDLANAERDLANAEKEHSAESTKSNSEREATVIKLTKALDKQSKAEENLKQKEKDAADAQELYNRANADAIAKHEALDKAKAEGNKKLQEESQKLSQLQGTREASVASLNQEKEAIKQKNEAVDAQAKIINDAQQTQAKSRQLSIESIEKSIALLKQENRVIGDETNPQWVENEKTIGRLNQRLSEMKQHAAELRGEAMSVSQAMDMSNAASGSIEQMEKAISVLQQAQRATTNDVDASRYSNAIDNLTQKLREAKGEAVSLEEAMEMADVNSKQPYSIEEMQKGLKALQEQQSTAIEPSQYTEAISVLTQKIREAKGEAVSLEDALNFGKQGLTGSFTGTTEQLRQAKQVLESTLATTAKGSDRYKEIREALAGIAVEEKRVGGVSAEVQKILDEPKGRSFNELKVAVEQGRKELNSMTRTTKEGQAAYDELAEKVKKADLELKNLGNESKGTQSSFEKAWSRLKTYVTLYMGTAVALQKMSGAVDDMMELSDKMGEVRKTTGFSADEVNRLSNNLAKLDTRTPIQDLMNMAAAAGQLGLNTEEDVRGFTEAANMLHVALPELGEEGATEMMKVALATGEVDKIRKQMQDGTVKGSSATAVAMEKVASVIDRLRATTAAAAPPVADFVKRVGAVGAQSGITVDQVAALGATVDELGMGTEMAATAISRMIPAIKNHAFDIAQSIGVTPDTIRRLYDTGHAMDVIVMILKHIKENNMQNDPNSIEKLLGTGGMQEIMKELDQQGARAGIVFAGLSQHVDELQKNLGTANTAYQQGTAILNEYNKMNDTTAAKMERLKNQISKVFVTASNSKAMGVIIDILRGLVSFITGNVNPALRVLSYLVKSVFIYWGILKIGLGEAIFIKAVDGAKELASGLKNLMSNTRAYMRYSALLSRAHDEEAKAAIRARMANEGLSKAMLTNIWTAAAAAAFYLVGTAIGKMSDKIEQAREEAAKVEEQEANMRAEQDRLGVSAKAVSDAYNNTLKQTLSDLQGSYAQLKSKWEELKTEQQKVRWIKDNQKAFKDLGLSIHSVRDAENVFNNNTDSVVDAFQRRAKAAAYAAKLTALYKRQIDLLDKKRTNAKEIANDAAYGGRSAKAGQEITDPTYHSSRYGYVNSAGKWVFSQQGAALYSGKSAKGNPQNDKIDRDLGSVNADIKQTSEDLRTLDTEIHPNGSNGNGGAGSGGKGGTGGGSTDKNNSWGDRPDASSTDWKKYNGKELVARRKQMNEFVLALQGDTDVESVLSEDPALMAAMKKGKVKNDADSVIAWYDQQRLAIQDVLHSRALSNTGNWQDPKVAHQRAKSISAMVKNDMSYYMDELDAYYTEQKSQIEDAQNSGLITEEEGWRRILENDRIWHQRRGELGQLYAGKTKEVTQQEADNIYSIIADRTGDTTNFIKVNIGKTNDLIHQAGLKNAAIERKILGDLDKGTEQDFLKMRTAVKKQLDAIEEIVSKERPFDGIVKNLRQNVEKMGIIYTDLDKQKEKLILSGKGNGSDEMKALNEEYAKERPNRLTFLLKESENAYQKTGDTLLSDMRANGFSSWADAITQSDDAEKLKEALVAQLHTVFDSVQDAIKKEASEVKKQVDIAWNDTNGPLLGGKSMKGLYEAAANALGVEQQSVSRANSLIGAGAASERVADKLAIRQLQIQLNMQEHYYALVRKIGQQRVDDLKRQEEQYRKQGDYAKAEEAALDAKHAKMSLNLTLSEEETDLAKQRAEINARVEESQNRLYTSLKEWGTLLSSSMQSLFEASNTGAADYYNNLAKMRLTGEGSAGGTYVIIDNAGTKDANAHYENLDGEDALKRQLEIEQQNAVADAWKKVMDDINKKISDQITDWMNAALQTQSIDANTIALEQNTAALYATRPKNEGTAAPTAGKWEMGKDENGNTLYPLQPTEEAESGDLSKWPRARRKRAGLSENGDYSAPAWQLSPLQQEDEKQHNTWTGLSEYGGGDETQQGASPLLSDDQMTAITDQNMQVAQSKIDASNAATEAVKAGNKAQLQSTKDTGGKMEKASKSTFAKMAQAANMYGIAYQAMSNDNMTTTQKFLSFAVQAAGQAAIAMLTTDLSGSQAQMATDMPGIYGKIMKQLGVPAGPIVIAGITAVLGGLMGLAVSKVSKSKSQIAQATGASVSAGRLSTGMLTYATGNVNEFTDPSTLTPGQQYNVDAADGHTYRARYMGANPKTHLTNGPEFHLVGERGREAIIDANTTRQLQMNDTGIWQAIQTLYNGGSIRSVRRGGMKAFAAGNIDELSEGATAATSENGTAPVPSDTDLLAALQASLDRNTEVMQKAVENGIKGVFNVYGKDGLIDSYDRGKKNANRYGERY